MLGAVSIHICHAIANMYCINSLVPSAGCKGREGVISIYWFDFKDKKNYNIVHLKTRGLQL
ncbi:MAG: hypothetical protein A3J83_04280 [Elusimicrobia bacterium RIFOXYA2_FULL_40_6]|nr:MAG: hypothetical protein A3J83_04280 [Elusimicrobia bacterium RIFOXYA2_FULL_40_6]